MENVFTDEMIKDNYGEIIEGLLLNGDYVNEKYAISLIRTILECGVNSLDLDKIEYICMKAMDIKNWDDKQSVYGYNSFNFSSNKTIIEEAIRVYNKKFGSTIVNLNDESLDETVDNSKPHSR